MFLLVSDCVNLYTLIAVIILVTLTIDITDSAVQVLSNNVGPVSSNLCLVYTW